jgi:recombination protein RecT
MTTTTTNQQAAHHAPPAQQSQAIERQRLLQDDLDRVKAALEKILPKHVTPERMIKVVLSATARNPDLLKCTRQSIVRAVMQAAELGLEIGGLLGEAYLVPYNEQVRCIIGYRGFIKLARQSGEIDAIDAHPVYEGDVFDVNFAESTIAHSPGDLTRNREEGRILAFYAIARYRRGFKQIDVMTLGEVNKIRARSKAANKGPWVDDFVEMGRKTVVRRLSKYLDLSAEVRRAFEIEAEHEERERSEVIDTPMLDGAVAEVAGTAQTAGAPAPAQPHEDGRRISLRGRRGAATAQAQQKAVETAAQADAGSDDGSVDAADAPAIVTSDVVPSGTGAGATPKENSKPTKTKPAETEPPFGSADQATPPRDWNAEAKALWDEISAADAAATLDRIGAKVESFAAAGPPVNLLKAIRSHLDDRRKRLGE